MSFFRPVKDFAESIVYHANLEQLAAVKTLYKELGASIELLEVRVAENADELILAAIQKKLGEYHGVESRLAGDTIHVYIGSDSWKIQLEETEIDPEERGKGNSPKIEEFKSPMTLKDHCKILDLCLAVLVQELCPFISDLTTDGDNSDCEAIFRLWDTYWILKIR